MKAKNTDTERKTPEEIEAELKNTGVGQSCRDHFMHACNRADNEAKPVSIPIQSKRGPHISKCLQQHGGAKRLSQLLNRKVELKDGSYVFSPQSAILQKAEKAVTQ